MRPITCAWITYICLPFLFPPIARPDGALAEGKPVPEKKTERTDRHGDPLPPGVVARLGTVRLRHPGGCWLVAYSPDGKFLASAGESVIIWEAKTGKLVKRLEQQQVPNKRFKDNARCLAFSPDGRYLAVGFEAHGQASRIHVWELATGKLFLPLVLPSGKDNHLNFVAFTADSRGVLAGNGRQVRLAEVRTGKEVWRWTLGKGDDDEVKLRGKALSHDGKTLAVAVHGRTKFSVRLLDAATGKERRQLGCVARSLAFAPDNRTLVALRREAERFQVSLWDIYTGKRLSTWKHSQTPLDDCSKEFALSPDGKVLAARRQLWDVSTGKSLSFIGGYKDEILSCVSFSPDGRRLAVQTDDGRAIEVWELTTGKRPIALSAHRKRVTALAYAPDGRTIATAASDRTIRLWEARTGKPIRCFGKLSRCPCQLTFSPDGSILAAAAGMYGERSSASTLPYVTPGGGGCITLWDPATGKELRELHATSGKEGTLFTCVAFAPDGKTLIAEGTDNTLRLWDVGTGKELRQIGQHTTPPCAVASPNGRIVASGSDGSVRLWDARTGTLLRTLEKLGPDCSPLYRLAFSPDGRLLASVNTLDCIFRLWDVAEGTRLREIRDHHRKMERGFQYDIHSLSFSPDGKSLLSSGFEGDVRVWEAATGQERFRLAEEAYQALPRFAPDGRAIAVARYPGSATAVLVWDVTSRQGRAKAEKEPPKLEALWADLAGADATRAYQAIWALAAVPKQSVSFLHKRLRPVPAVTADRLKALIADLDNGDFKVRERASKELEIIGEAAKHPLQQALEGQPTLEKRRRIERLLEHLDGVPAPERLRALRGIEALEHMATPAAVALLERLAKGATGAAETECAQRALQRLRKQKPD